MPILTADVPSELIEQLDRVADAESKQLDVTVSRSALIRRALREFLSRTLSNRPSHETNDPRPARDAA